VLCLHSKGGFDVQLIQLLTFDCFRNFRPDVFVLIVFFFDYHGLVLDSGGKTREVSRFFDEIKLLELFLNLLVVWIDLLCTFHVFNCIRYQSVGLFNQRKINQGIQLVKYFARFCGLFKG
jgi:hypothetical protein